MSVSYYDLLDVDESASADEIRAAWRAAVADLDPTDRRFRAYNDAASVLLDADKRAAYDAELAAARADDEDEEAAPADEPAAAEMDDEPAPAPAPADEPVVQVSPPAEDAPRPTEPPATATDTAPSSGPPSWALFFAAGLAVVFVVLLVVVLTWPGSVGGESPKELADSSATAEKSGAAAEAAAEQAVPVVLSYDYRTLDQDFAEAAKYLTDDFAKQRTDLFAQKADGGSTLRDQVVADKVVVTATAPLSGLTRVSADGSRATVVVYVDQESRKADAAPRILQMWATLTMVEDGDDWLIDDICTESDCS